MKYEFKWASEFLFGAAIAASVYVIQGVLDTDLSTVENGRELATSLVAGAGRVFFAVLATGLAKVRPS